MRQKILQQYASERDGVALDLPLAPYDWHKLNNSISIEWMAYSQFLQEHAPELSNSINEFKQYILSLSAWESALGAFSEKEKHHAVFEYISSLATLAINTPYVIRSRYIYSAAHLSHQANKVKSQKWVDDLPIDDEIYFEQANVYGKQWKKYGKLKLALEKISNKEYQKSTHNFRNTYNHRYSPRIEVGLTGFVTRIVGDKGVSYGFGETSPLMLKDIVPLLITQHSYLIKAYVKYQALVNEQVSEINNV